MPPAHSESQHSELQSSYHVQVNYFLTLPPTVPSVSDQMETFVLKTSAALDLAVVPAVAAVCVSSHIIGKSQALQKLVI